MARLVGIDHVALEVGDVDDALELYARLFEFELRGRAGRVAFVDMRGGSRSSTTATSSSSAPGVKRKLAIEGLEKRDSAEAEIRDRGLS